VKKKSNKAKQASRSEHSWSLEPCAVNPAARPALFGIVQGGLEEDLRAESIAFTAGQGFDGVAVGGLAVGEPREDYLRLCEFCGPRLPAGQVHYLMGVGNPADLLHAIAQGFDLFDCVQPTRMARHGVAYTRDGNLNLHNARFRADPRPLDAQCRCSVCREYSRAYLRHLLKLEEHSYARLLTLHNLAFYQGLLSRARRRIVKGRYGDWWPGAYARMDRVLPEDL
jgi:queuine tRNA-ribosyltransferase